MRSLPATLLAFLLLLMLAVTTPMGTGDGIHDSVLLHPLFSHSHLVDGRIVSHEQLARVAANASPDLSKGPAIGAGAGASAALADAVAISPTLPWQDLQLTTLPPLASRIHEATMPTGWVTAPPDPPPTSR